ncbi:hypothetical protein [Chelativorans oligotrophicus]|uniref:hypothetical protein n=1 Tax=Chelativorans oligotrophicus TaxID=449974 RepID=UPI00140E353A|nr:hypothetical protein [Chelativorans oligotrophicus]
MGDDGQRFWSLTLREIRNILEGHLARLKCDHRNRAWAVWHTAHLTAYAPTKPKDFVRLEKLLRIEGDKPRRKRDWREDFAAMSAWAQGSAKFKR